MQGKPLDQLVSCVMKIRHGLVAISMMIGTCATIGAVPVQALTCQETGENCAVGERGPKGGIIFYDAGSQQWWGRYLEAKIGAEPIRKPWLSVRYSIYELNGQEREVERQKVLQRRSMAIGMGRDNTEALMNAASPLVNAMFPTNEDWFLPSKDELDALYNYRVQNDGQGKAYWNSVPVWTSSESEPGFAWYQLFQDGTQFTDAQGILPGKKMNVDYLKSPMHTGSDFIQLPMNIIRVRAFPSPSPWPPKFSFVNAVREDSDCLTKALNCRIGDRGPAGGIVVYDAGSDLQWGRYLEIAPQSCEIVKVAFNSNRNRRRLNYSNDERIKAKAIGMGAQNTAQLKGVYPGGAASKAFLSNCNNFHDWFLPSKDELNEVFRQLSHSRTGLQLTPVGGFDRGYYWTSSDYNGETAWAQYFADGQQFDRVQTLDGNRKPPARPFRVRPMRAFKSGDTSGKTLADKGL
jgi:hypothetical protein